MSLQACADLVARADPDRFLSAMAAPVAAREVLLPLYAFNTEVARAPWLTEEPPIAEMRLQWWRDALDEIAGGGPVRRHEVATPLAGVLDAEGAGLLGRLVASRRWDIYRDPFEDEGHFQEYLDATGAGLIWVAARALGATVEAPVRAFGRAAALAAWFRAVPGLEARGRLPLVDGRPEAVQALAREGLSRLGDARAARRAVPRSAAPALLAGWQTGRVLRAAARDPGLVAAGGLEPSEARRRAGLLWRSSLGRW